MNTEYKKKIIAISPAYPYRGGQALVEAYLYKTLSESGYDFQTVSYKLLYPSVFFPGTTQFDTSKTVPFEHSEKIFRILNSINPFTWWRAYRHIKKQKPSAVIIVWWMPFFGPCLGFLARKIKKSLKDTKVIFLVENYVSHENRPFDRFFTRHTLKRADVLICESSFIKEQIVTDFPEKQIFQTTLSVYSCYNSNRYTKASAREKLNITDKNVVLFFGLIRPYKGLDKLIETFPEILKTQPDTTLLIVGECYEDIDKYHKLIEQYDLKKNTLLIDKFIPNEEVELFFKASDLIVMPYYSGTQSGILMVAYAFGIPVVVTNVGGIAELVNEKTGTVVKDNSVSNLAPAILNVMQNPSQIPYEENIRNITQSLGYANMNEIMTRIID